MNDDLSKEEAERRTTETLRRLLTTPKAKPAPAPKPLPENYDPQKIRTIPPPKPTQPS